MGREAVLGVSAGDGNTGTKVTRPVKKSAATPDDRQDLWHVVCFVDVLAVPVRELFRVSLDVSDRVLDVLRRDLVPFGVGVLGLVGPSTQGLHTLMVMLEQSP